MNDDAIITQNLRENAGGIPDAVECRMAYIADAAYAMTPDSATPCDELPGVLGDIGERFRKMLCDAMPPFGECAAVHREEVGRVLGAYAEQDTALFSLRLYRRMRERGLSVLPNALKTPESYYVAYVPNPLTNEAFRCFTVKEKTAVGLLSDNFREAAEAVTAGRAFLCLVPFESTGGGRVSSAVSLLSQYDLFVTGVIPVPDGDNTVYFALLSGGRVSLAENENMLVCRVIPSPRFSVGAVLRAAALYGMDVLRCDFEKRSASGAPSYFLTLAALSDVPPDAFLVYAHAFTASCTVYGVFGTVT